MPRLMMLKEENSYEGRSLHDLGILLGGGPVNEVRPTARRSRRRRAQEIQGMFAMHGLELETEPESKATEIGTESSAPGERASEVNPLPYRMVLANWPDVWRERWGRRANDFEEQEGLSWRDAEGRAFVEVWGEFRSSSIERN